MLDPLEAQVVSVVDYADQGSMPILAVITAVNGIAEELFFRGCGLRRDHRRSPVLWTTLAYAVATLATGNVMLSFAAVLLGLVCGLERRASGGILAPDPHALHLVADDAAGAAAPLLLSLFY